MTSNRSINGFYLSTFDLLNKNHALSGVERKILNQINCFNEAGLNCTPIFCKESNNRIRRGIGTLPFVSDGIAWPSAASLKDASYLYIRRPLFFSKELLKFLMKVRAFNPSILIIVELPTYPYDKEMNKPELFFAAKKDVKYRNLLHKCIDYIADLSGADRIFNIPTLHIINGIDLKNVFPRTPSYYPEKPIEMIFPAQFGPWHGCDLVLQGLGEYYKSGGNRNIILHLAGEGPETGHLRKLVDSLNLSDHVVLHGFKSRTQLDALYNQCTLGVGCFGLHRRDSNCLDSSLKTREYLAKGIPFIYAGKVDVLESNPQDFCLGFKSIESPPDFEHVIAFHDHLYSANDENDLIRRIRSFAERTVSMQSAMSSVIWVLKNAKTL